MTAFRLADFLAQLAAFPPGSLVPVAWVCEQVQAIEPEPAGEPDVFTVPDLARRWRRGASTVRAILEHGEIGEAYRHRGREWRVPRAAVLAYEATQQTQHAPTRRARHVPSLQQLARGEATP